MPHDRKYYKSYRQREWELLQSELAITVTPAHLVKIGISIQKPIKLRIKRDQFHKLEISIPFDLSVISSGFLELLNPSNMDGFFIKGPTLSAITSDRRYLIDLENVFLKSLGIFDPTLLRAAKMRYSVRHPSTIEKHIDWFLNGPQNDSNFNLPNCAYKGDDGQIQIRRGEAIPTTVQASSWRYWRHFACLKASYGNTSFLIFKVTQKFGPSWSNSLGIEYRREWGGIPDDDTRCAIAELIGFVFGRPILFTASSCYDASDKLISGVCENPWSNNAPRKCDLHEYPPLMGEVFRNEHFSGEMICNLLPVYIEHRHDWRLKDALWKYWDASDSSVDNTIACYFTALEMLAKALPQKEKATTLFSEKYFSSIKKGLTDTLTQMRDELARSQTTPDLSDSFRIISNKIGNLNQAGVYKGLDLLFENIALPIGDDEKSILKNRNAIIHGDPKSTKEKILITYAMKTLFHRVFLKILGHNGAYTCYCARGNVRLPIDQPILNDIATMP